MPIVYVCYVKKNMCWVLRGRCCYFEVGLHMRQSQKVVEGGRPGAEAMSVQVSHQACHRRGLQLIANWPAHVKSKVQADVSSCAQIQFRGIVPWPHICQSIHQDLLGLTSLKDTRSGSLKALKANNLAAGTAVC